MYKIQNPETEFKGLLGHLKLELGIYLGFGVWNSGFSFSDGERSFFHT